MRVRNPLCNNPYQDIYTKEPHSNPFLPYTGHCRNSYTLSEKRCHSTTSPVNTCKYGTETWIFQYPMKDLMIVEIFLQII